jgi:hypothetical protein
MIMALLIIAILTHQYMAPTAPGAKPAPVMMVDRARTAASAASLRNVETHMMMEEMDGRMSPSQRRAYLAKVPPAPDGGRFFMDPTGRLNSTTLIEYRKFRDQYQLPGVR